MVQKLFGAEKFEPFKLKPHVWLISVSIFNYTWGNLTDFRERDRETAARPFHLRSFVHVFFSVARYGGWRGTVIPR